MREDPPAYRFIVMVGVIFALILMAGCTTNGELAAALPEPDKLQRTATAEAEMEIDGARSTVCPPPFSTCGFTSDNAAKITVPTGAWTSATITAFWNATGPTGNELEFLLFDGPDGEEIGSAKGTAPLQIVLETGEAPGLGGKEIYVHGAPAAPGAAVKLSVHLVLVVTETGEHA